MNDAKLLPILAHKNYAASSALKAREPASLYASALFRLAAAAHTFSNYPRAQPLLAGRGHYSRARAGAATGAARRRKIRL